MTLDFVGSIALPADAGGGFDHGDVHLPSGRVFVAHTGNNTVEVLDGPGLRLEQTLTGCSEGSGVLCTSGAAELVVAAGRGDGTLLFFDPVTCGLQRRVQVGPRPNGLAWDDVRGQLLVADVEAFDARLIDSGTGACVVLHSLPGRPRWCVYDAPRQRFLINIREPACVVALAARSLEELARVEGLPAGPHGMDLDRAGERAFVACDEGQLCVLDLTTDREVARVPIAGEPDAVWFSPTARSAYVAIGKPGVVDVVDGKRVEVTQRLSTGEGAHTTAFDSRRRRLYVFLPESSEAAGYAETADR